MSTPGAPAIFAESRDAGPLARLDPRTRLLAALGAILVLVTLSSPAVLLAAVALAALLAVFARLPLRATLKRLAAVEAFLVLLLVSLPFTMAGEPLISVLGLPFSREGLMLAVAIALRVNAAILLAAALLSQMGTIGLARAMTGLGVPPALAHLTQLTVRYIAVFQEEYQRLARAMRARAFRPQSTLHGWRSLGYLVGMLLVRSVERAERVLRAMKCRGFSGRFPALDHGRLGRADILFLALWATLFAALALTEHLP